MKRTVLAGIFVIVLIFFAVDAAFCAAGVPFDAGVTYTGVSDSEDDEESIQRTLVWAQTNVPFPLWDGTRFILGFSYTGQYVDYSDVDDFDFKTGTVEEEDLPEFLHAVDFGFGFSMDLTGGWNSAIQFRPGIHSDFEDIDGEDFIYQGVFMIEKRFYENNAVGFGVSYTDIFGEPGVVPLVKVQWYPSENWFVEALLPSELDLGFQLYPDFAMGIEAKLRGYEYKLSENSPWDGSVLQYREIQAGPFIDFIFAESLHAKFSSGIVTGQEFEFTDDDDDVLLEGDYEDTFYLTVNLFITF